MFYVYLLKCRDDSFYCGYTSDLAARLKKHNAGTASKYTRARLPVVLVYSEQLSTRGEALAREYRIKQYTRKQKEALCATGALR